ncbi:MAG: hypothetical protein HYS86_04860 [Candidatus Chisholmbacteria bacterium]|nr:hypothetical protein [Candidatus Chisholmbacteria bacterium]
MAERNSRITLPPELQKMAEGESAEAVIAASFVAFLQASIQTGRLSMAQVISVASWINIGVQAMSNQQNGKEGDEVESR